MQRLITREVKLAIQFTQMLCKVKQITTKQYAALTGEPLFFVQRTARKLHLKKVVKAKDGYGGGYRLNKGITVLDIFKALDSIGIVTEMLTILPNINSKIADMRF